MGAAQREQRPLAGALGVRRRRSHHWAARSKSRTRSQAMIMLQQHEPIAERVVELAAGDRGGALVEQAGALLDPAEADQREALQRPRRHLDVEAAVGPGVLERPRCSGAGRPRRRCRGGTTPRSGTARRARAQAAASSVSRRARWSQPLATAVAPRMAPWSQARSAARVAAGPSCWPRLGAARRPAPGRRWRRRRRRATSWPRRSPPGPRATPRRRAPRRTGRGPRSRSCRATRSARRPRAPGPRRLAVPRPASAPSSVDVTAMLPRPPSLARGGQAVAARHLTGRRRLVSTRRGSRCRRSTGGPSEGRRCPTTARGRSRRRPSRTSPHWSRPTTGSGAVAGAWGSTPRARGGARTRS